MIFYLDYTKQEICHRMKPFLDQISAYCDVSPGEQNFDLGVLDCWGGLYRAKQLGWVDFKQNRFEADKYLHYDSPLNGDLHEVVPSKFIAMRGPVRLPRGVEWRDAKTRTGRFSHRDFSPAYYVDILRQFDVRTVLRLNEPEYDARQFEQGGIAVVDLVFDDCTAPPPEVVARFLALAEALPGAVAVHCKAGLGRTGTLIGLYLMKHHGFSAREAMGWLRIVRPGSVIGEQQQYLCGMEALMHRTGEAFRRRESLRQCDSAAAAVPGDVAALKRVVAQTEERVRTALARLEGRPTLPRDSEAAPAAGRVGGQKSPTAAGGGAAAARELASHVKAAAGRRARASSFRVDGPGRLQGTGAASARGPTHEA